MACGCFVVKADRSDTADYCSRRPGPLTGTTTTTIMATEKPLFSR
jgi:hypothetical protein